MENKVTIVNPKGQKVVADLITVFKIKENNQEYALYTFNQNDQEGKIKDYVSRIKVENGQYFFDAITDDKEWEMVKEAISKIKVGEVQYE